jgi:integrase
MSVRELFDAWDEHLLWRVEQDDIRLSTVTYYRWARPHIESVLGEVRVVDVSTDTLKPLFDVKRHPTLSKGSIAKLRTCVSSLLGFAQEELKVIKHNVVRDMKPLRLKEKNDRSAMSPEQAAKLAGYLRSRALKGGMEIIWLTILSLGLRRSEALGLRWMDLDLEKGVVKIRKQLVWGADKGMGRLKTVSSERALALPKELTSILKRHKRAQALQRLALGKEWKVADAVFDHNGRYWYPSSVSAGFKRLTTWKKVDPDTDEEVLVSGKEWLEHPEERSNWVVHELRHTYASLLFDEGFEISTISALLGHSSETVTLDLYVHLLKKVPRNAAKAMGGCLFGKRKAS